MSDNAKIILLLLFFAAAFIGVVVLSIRTYEECRDAGFTRLYCISRR